MNLFISSIFLAGLSGIVVQVMLLRELLVSFYGNELTLGLILSVWIISEASGVFIIGKIIDRIRNKLNIFVILQVLFSLILPLSVYFSRTFKPILGIPFGEGVSLSIIFYSLFLIIFPVGFCHGALFSCGCKVYSSYVKKPVSSIGKIYTWETIGTIIGGIVLTYLLIPHLSSFQIVFIVSASNLIICLFFFRRISTVLRYGTLLLFITLGCFSLTGGINNLHRFSLDRQWQGQKILDYRNSIYGNIVVTEREKQYTFFYNGIPIITAPYPDMTFVQEFGNLPLLFHAHPEDVLVISGGAGGLIHEFLKHPIKKIDYAELDPMIIKMLQKYPSGLIQRELTDQRVNIINADGRFFVKNTINQYDIVLIGLSKPQDLSTNRIFTQEFFALAKKRLKPGGILAFYLPGSLTYISNELRDLNACILNGLKMAFAYIRIIPGDYNIFLASDSGAILEANSDSITQEILKRNIKTTILIPEYLDYRLNKSRVEWFNKSLRNATRRVNQDTRPFALFEALVLWNKQFSGGEADIFEVLKNINLISIAIFLLFVTFILFLVLYRKPNLSRLNVAYSIATTGFFGMLANLILIFSFQVIHGYLYYKIGLLISIFMSGTALGSILMTNRAEKIKDNLSLFVKLEMVIALFSYALALIITRLTAGAYSSSLNFIALFFLAGLFLGLEFPLASKIYLENDERLGFVSGVLYSSDLIGGCLAGLLGAIVFLPILGLFNTCMVIILVKLSSLILLGIFRKILTKIAI